MSRKHRPAVLACCVIPAQADGTYFFDSGTTIGGSRYASYFTFNVSAGRIATLSNAAAASIVDGGQSLLLNYCSIVNTRDGVYAKLVRLQFAEGEAA